jgi:Ca2+-binding RTX toxin-like protein
MVELSDIEAGTGGFVINGVSAFDVSGKSVSGGGDVNGDGLADLIIGALNDDPNGNSYSGASFVVFGSATPATTTPTTTAGEVLASNVTVNADGTTSSSFSNTTGATARAVLIENTGTGNFVAANLPNQVALTNNGAATAEETTTATASLASQIDAAGDASTGKAFLLAGAAGFMGSKAAGGFFDVRTLTPSSLDGAAPSDAIGFTGSTAGIGEDAFVIDTRGLPVGSSLTLDNIEFAAIIGATTITCGAGQNYVVGDDFAQNITLGALDDTLLGGGGDDLVASAFGEDILYGNQGNDAVKGGGGRDSLYGGQGNDAIEGQNDADMLFGNLGADTVNGGQGTDVVYGNQGADTVLGGTGLDTLFGGQGDDILYGNQGADNLSGNLGADILYVGLDADTIDGGGGADTLVGGLGRDSFVLSVSGGADTVLDFSIGQGDRLQVDIAGSGITSLGELTQNLSTDGAGNLLVSLGGGDGLTLIGLSASDTSNIGVDLISAGTVVSTGMLDGSVVPAASAGASHISPLLDWDYWAS